MNLSETACFKKQNATNKEIVTHHIVETMQVGT